ncbi:hypothetical protein [Terriglobus sp. TAA 43]|uniref:hypothetical protein n=1 Tax=Terriglobus sp. TAA 43 TaxID=278961 RepID=UPI0006470FBD|nr:hypothetical protein [Terriglobus sp. TAA 43]
MNYETVVPELFNRFPELEAIYRAKFAYMGDDEAIHYIVFGSILIPALTAALEEGNLGAILPISAFMEDASVAARHDNSLATLMKVEVGEWLGWASHEERLAPWLGPETKRLCNYVPGLATQRIRLRSEEKAQTISARLSALFGGRKLP